MTYIGSYRSTIGDEYAVIVVWRIDLLSLLLFSNHFILASSKKQADRWSTNTLQKNMTNRMYNRGWWRTQDSNIVS